MVFMEAWYESGAGPGGFEPRQRRSRQIQQRGSEECAHITSCCASIALCGDGFWIAMLLYCVILFCLMLRSGFCLMILCVAFWLLVSPL